MVRQDYTDPRARRLVTHAWLALALAGLMVVMLAAMLLGSGGVWSWLEWSVTAVIAGLGAAAEACTLVARQVETAALAAWYAPPPASTASTAVRTARATVPVRRLGGVTRVEVPVRVRPDLLPRRAPVPAPVTEHSPVAVPLAEQLRPAPVAAGSSEGGAS